MDAGKETSRRAYERRAERFGARRAVHARRLHRIGKARTAAFAGIVAAVLSYEWSGRPGALPLILAGIFAAAFVVLLRWHGWERGQERWHSALRDVNREALARLDRRWEALPGKSLGEASAEHAYSADLDIFGHASLFRLLDTAGTPAGTAKLQEWLLSPAPPDVIAERQAAAAELAKEIDLREELTVRARRVEDASPRQLETFLRWSEGSAALATRPALVWSTRLLPLATVVLLAFQVSGVIGAAYWLLPLLGGLVLTLVYRNAIETVFRGAFPRQGIFRHYPQIFRLLLAGSFRSPALRRIQRELNTGGVPADRRMRRLERLMELADVRFSIFAHFHLQLFTLWDFHVAFALERWRQVAARSPRRWFTALGETEALAAFAGLVHAHPLWAFPQMEHGQDPRVQATSLGHPLLAEDARVDNDVVIGPRNRFLLVTGSNMSGKSTLLRAIGVNAVLAQAGGPVCARELRLPPLDLYTSMRVQDSLEEGVSYFMGELKRLKNVVDAAGSVTPQSGRTLLYLLDEILQGTNTAERQIAARRLIGHLLAEGAIGAISTHDLTLAESDSLAVAACAVHFRETVHPPGAGPAMTFDYRLRPGLATSTNALRLVEIVGFGGV